MLTLLKHGYTKADVFSMPLREVFLMMRAIREFDSIARMVSISDMLTASRAAPDDVEQVIQQLRFGQ